MNGNVACCLPSSTPKRHSMLPEVCQMKVVSVCVLILVFGAVLLVQTAPTERAWQLMKTNRTTVNSAKIVAQYGKLPLSFEQNQGQTDPRVKFVSHGPGYTLFLTGDGAVFSLRDPNRDSAAVGRLNASGSTDNKRAVLEMRLCNSSPVATVAGVTELPGKANYFIGNTSSRWLEDVPTYSKISYRGIYRGVDLAFYGNQQQLEYDFVVAPRGDPNEIRLELRGADHIKIDEDGNLVLAIGKGEMRWHPPVAYQIRNNERQQVAAKYILHDDHQIGFLVNDYDPSRALVIDPALVFSTFLGGSGNDDTYGVAVDSTGNAYIVGDTQSSDFPTTQGAFQTHSAGGQYDAFVSKLNPSGSAVVYSTYLGGSNTERGFGIAVDTSGNAYIAGETQSVDFPISQGAFQTTCNNGSACDQAGDAFVTALNPTGSGLVYSTYLGGSDSEEAQSVAVDTSGNAYVTGLTGSTDFPTTPGAFQTSCGGICSGVFDAFVTKLNAAGSALVYSTYLGGTLNDDATAIAIDSTGDAYVTGSTCSTDFPVTSGAFQTSYHGGGCALGDAFVTKINPNGSALLFSTFLGGTGDDYAGFSMSVDLAGNAYVVGTTCSTDFPTTPGAFQTSYAGPGCPNGDAFVTKIGSTGSSAIFSTYLGGSSYESGFGIATDSTGNSYVTGSTSSTDFPLTPGSFQITCGGGCTSNIGDAFVTKLNWAGSGVLYSTYLGGSSYDYGIGVGLDSAGNAYVAGATFSSDFPVTPGAFQITCGGACAVGAGDAFLVKFTPGPQLWPVSLSFASQTVGTTSTPQAITLTNSGTTVLTITNISVTGTNSGDFAESNDCGSSLVAGAKCTITVTFTPTATGSRVAAVSIADSAPNSPQSVPLTGVGVSPSVLLSPTSLTFPTQTVFTPSKSQAVTLTNSGAGILTIKAITATRQFIQTNTCGTTVNPGSSCTMNVVFKPTSKGAINGSVSITDNAPGSPQQITLTGTGTFVQLTPATVNFGSQPVGTTSLPKRITFTNKGSVPVNISSISITGTNVTDFVETNTCGSSVAGGGSCFIKVTFTPSAKGKRNANVSINDDGGGSPQTVPLSGTGT